MSNKKQQLLRLLERVELRWKLPQVQPGGSLLDAGMLAVLMRRLGAKDAESTIRALHQGFPDWNELRVCQPQEIVPHVKVRQEALATHVAMDVRDYLNEIYWKNHGFDLEFMRADALAAARFAGSLEWIGAHVGHWLMHVADPSAVPVTPAMVRVLDRIGLSERIGSIKKARGTIEQLVAKGGELDFAVRLGEIADRWCNGARPLCPECPLVGDCAHGRKVYRDWKLQQARMEAQRRRDFARQEILRKKEEQRLAREAVRLKKKQEADAKRLARESAMLAKARAAAKAAGKSLAAAKPQKPASASGKSAQKPPAKAPSKPPARSSVKPAPVAKPLPKPAGHRPPARPSVRPASPAGKPSASAHRSPASGRAH